jgi:hypothetical protein
VKTAERLHVCPDHGATEQDGPGSCCKKGRSVASIQRMNSHGLPNTHMVADLAEALLAERCAHRLALRAANLEKERERLRGALVFYAATEAYLLGDVPGAKTVGERFDPPIMRDGGSLARKVLVNQEGRLDG